MERAQGKGRRAKSEGSRAKGTGRRVKGEGRNGNIEILRLQLHEI
jgi:hypothetical protein